MAVVSAWTPTSWATSSSASRLPSMSSMRALMRSASSRAPAGAAGEWRTAYAIDGDTIKVGPTTVRLLGYDTPEVGQRCHTQATRKAAAPDPQRCPDPQCDRQGPVRPAAPWRMSKPAPGRDVGTAMLKAGLAIARYDSLDGYERHPKQNKYRAIDARNGQISCKRGSGNPQPGTYYSNCTEVENAGAAPIRRGDPGYGPHLDRDGDGVACET